MMEKLLMETLLLLLVLTNGGTSSDDFCLNKSCPDYTLEHRNDDFEVRNYAPSDWITTRMKHNEASDVIAASKSLKAAGYVFHSENWPVLITQMDSDNGTQWSMSFFVPPDTTRPENNDPSVTLEHKPAAKVYVKVFGGTPNRDRGLENVKLLQKALEDAKKSFDPRVSVGAGYESYFSWTHHNEIWIYAN